MAKQRSRKWARQAALQTLLRFGPEESGLAELQRQAQENYSSAVQTAVGTRAGTVNAIDQATPEMASIYDQAGLDQARTGQTLIGHDLAGLGSVADSIKGGAALEVATQLGNLSKARTQALGNLQTQRVAAVAGEGFAKQNAQRTLVSDLTKVLTRKQDLSREKGAFKALTYQQLQEAARKEAADLAKLNRTLTQQERNSIRSSGTDPTTGEPTQNAKTAAAKESRQAAKDAKTAKGEGRLSPEKHLAATEKLDDAMSWLRRLDPDKSDRHEVAPILATGVKQPAVPGQQVYDPATGDKQLNKDGTPRMTAGRPAREIPKAGALYATVAADIYYDGHLSRANEKRLRSAGFSLKRLGLPTYEQWRRAGKPGQKKPPTPKQVAQSIVKGIPDFSLNPPG